MQEIKTLSLQHFILIITHDVSKNCDIEQSTTTTIRLN